MIEPRLHPDAGEVRAAAEAYLARGWHPIPIQPMRPGRAATGKAPTLKGWQTRHVTAADVPRFWPNGSRNNIGLSCGPSRLVVLDFDEPDAYAPWAAAHPEAAQSYTVARNNAEPGRCHVYFTLGEEQAAPAQLTKKAVGWGDLKTDGGQVVAPPSVHYTGGRYRDNGAEPLPWLDEYTPEPWGMDEGGFDWNEPLEPPRKPTDAPGIPPSVQAAIERGAPEGERNASAFDIACQLRDEGHSAAVIHGHLERFAARCSPPMDAREIGAVIASVFSKSPRAPARNTSRAERLDGEAAEIAGNWTEPAALGDLDGKPPAWRWDVFPAPLRRIGQAITETMNVPDELPGLAVLCAASIAAGKVACVEIKPGHRQYANLYGMAALPAAAGKSPALRPIQAPLIARQIDLRTEHRKALRDWKGASKVARARIAALEKAATKGDGNPAELAAEIARLEAVEEQKPPEPILIADNATPEALARILAGNGGALGIFSADGRDILAIAGGKYSQGGAADVSVWLKAHAGDYLAYHRSNPDKPPFECVEPILAALVAVQPDALKALGQSRTLRESGFLARWLYVIPECPPGNYPEQSIMESITGEYGRTLAALLAMPPDTDPDGNPCPHVCRLDTAARAVWIAAHDALKREAHEAPPLLAQCLGKLPEHIARIVLVFHLVECAERGTAPGTITEQDIERAADLGAVLLAHLRRAVSYLGESGERATARDLLPVIWKHRDTLRERRAAEGLGDLAAVKPRDVARGRWAGIQSTEEARTALHELDVSGWLRLRNMPRYGARDHEIYDMHPTANP